MTPTLNKPVTVLMPAYNAQRTIEASIRSVMEQTYSNWDLLVIDDGSTDGTAAICRRLAAEDKRVVYHPSSHIGFSGVLNLGLRLIQSRYVARLDSDDLAYPTRLEKQMRFLEDRPDVKVLGTWGERINDRGKRVSRLELGPINDEEFRSFQQARKPVFLIHSSVTADRQTLIEFGGFREEDYPSDDIWLWTRIAQQHPVLAIPDNLAGYRISPAGISSSTLWLMILQWSRLEHNLTHGADLSMKDFSALIDRNPFLKLRYRRGFLHKYAFRTGAYYFYNRSRIRGGLYLAAGALLNPTHALKRLMYQT